MLPPQLPGHLLPGIWEVPDVGIVVVAAVPLTDHRDRLAAARKESGHTGGIERHRHRDARMQVRVAVVTDRGGPVAVDGREVVVEVPAPAAARAVIFDPLAQPVPLQRAGRRFGVQDQAGQLLAAPVVLGGLVAGQPDAVRPVAVLDMDRASGRSAVGDLLPASRACPGQRRVAALAAGELPDCVLGGGEQRLRPPGRGRFPNGRSTPPRPSGPSRASHAAAITSHRLPAARAAAASRTSSASGGSHQRRK